MSKAKLTTGLRPISDVTFADSTYWMRMNMHEVITTETISWTGKGTAGEVSGTHAPAGTKGAIFDNRGEFTSAGDHKAVAITDLKLLMSDIMRTDDLNGGTMLVLCDISKSATSADGYLFNHNNPGAAQTDGEYGWGIRLVDASNKCQFMHANAEGTILAIDALAEDNTKQTLAVYIQGSASAGYNMGLSMNGGGTQNNTSTRSCGRGATTYYVGVLGLANAAGVLSNDLQAGVRMSELLMLKTSKDIRADFTQIATDYADHKGDLPWILDGV